MPIVRNWKDFSKLPPDVWVNELPIPQSDIIQMGDFVLAVIGKFEKGPVDQYIYASESPSRNLVEAVSDILGKPSDSDGFPGNQVLEHIKNAKIKKCVFINVRGKGAAVSSIILKSDGENAKDILKIEPKFGPGTYGDLCFAQVETGSDNTFTLKLFSNGNNEEVFKNLTMDKKSENYAINTVNAKSQYFTLTDLNDDENSFVNPAAISKTALTGGAEGSEITQEDYIGSFDINTGKRTGLKLLETVGSIVTDVCYADFSSFDADEALASFGIKYNCMTYCGVGEAKTLEQVFEYRKRFDTDFMQMVYGKYEANSGAVIDGAALSAIVHTVSNVEDSGLSIECHWIKKSLNEIDFEQQIDIYENEVSAFVLKPSASGDGSYAFRQANDYTLAVTDVDGSMISSIENRKVNRRRINSWIEKALFSVSAPWQGKAMTQAMKDRAAIRLRTFLDQLKEPLNPLENTKIADYSITFDENAATMDQFVNTLKIKHYNTAEWVVLNYQGGTNVEV